MGRCKFDRCGAHSAQGRAYPSQVSRGRVTQRRHAVGGATLALGGGSRRVRTYWFFFRRPAPPCASCPPAPSIAGLLPARSGPRPTISVPGSTLPLSARALSVVLSPQRTLSSLVREAA